MIGTSEAFLKSIRDVVIEAEERTKKADRSWMHIGQTVEEIGRKFETSWTAAIAKSFGKQGQIMTAMDKLSVFLKDPSIAKGQLAQMTEQGKKMRADIETLLTKKIALLSTGTKLSAQEESALKTGVAKLATLDKQTKALKKIVDLNIDQMIWLPAILGSVKGTAEWTDKIQVALITTNAALKERYHLMADINQVQRSTGASTETMAEATTAATKHAMQMGPSFRGNLDIIVKMKEGLGVSSENTAMLLATMNRMGQSSLGVANAIAKIKANSGLAADEAARLATELTRAMSVIAPGGDVAGVLEKMGRLEGAAVKLGFTSGKITDMMLKMTTQGGLMGLGMLGLQPDFIKDQTTAMMGFQRMVEFTEVQLKAAGTNAYARQAVLEQYAEIFGTTTDVIANGRKILEEYNKQQGTATTLQQEWQQQTSTFAKSWDKLKNQLGALIHGALLPLVKVLQKAVDGLTAVTTWVLQTKGALWGMVAALTAATAATIYQSRALFANLGGPLKSLASFLPGAKTLAPLLGRIGPALGMVGGPLAVILKLFGAIGIAGSLGWTIGKLINTNTWVQKTTEKLFTALLSPTVHGISGTTDPLRGGTMTGGQWKARVQSMRQRGYGEDVVGAWAQAHIKDITELKTMDLGHLAKAAKGLQDWFVESGEARQSLKMFQTTTQTSQSVYDETVKQTKILEAIQEAAEMQAEAARQGRLDMQNIAERAALQSQLNQNEDAISRQKGGVKKCY